MVEKNFDVSLSDSQGTTVSPLEPEKFDIERYVDYEQSLRENTMNFWQASEGIAVYRRFRVPQVFSEGCRDMEYSLALQLGGLNESMNYKMDIPNFLEPWYGIGTAVSAFGVEYKWEPGNAPAIAAPFKSFDDALNQNIVPIEKTEIGRHTLDMIDYFLTKTQGKIPISLTDTQSALNAASFLIETNNFYMGLFDNPDGLKKLLKIITDLTIDFTKKQMELIGDALVSPGHGFPSSRHFTGLGMSSDVLIMVSDDQYQEFEIPCSEKMAAPFGGPVFHSCGNWSSKISSVKSIRELLMVDGAFSQQTDPDPNPTEPFHDGFVNSGITVNARIVGNADVVIEKARQLWQPGMKLIVTTYCQTAEEQAKVCDAVKELA